MGTGSCANTVSNLFIDVLAPLRRLSLSLQSELHEPVKQIKRVQQFTWTMSKLKLLIDSSLDDEENPTLTHYNRLLKEVKEENGVYSYQGITIRNYVASKNAVSKSYSNIITNVTENMELRFQDLTASPIFSNLTRILDVKTWPTKENDLSLFADTSILEVGDHFESLLQANGCDTDLLLSEWLTLKTHMIPIVRKNPDENYLKIWQQVFKSTEIQSECNNIFHVIEILLCTPFSNAKLERMFSRMARVKNDYRNRLSRDLLDACLRVSEEGCEIASFNPDSAISVWYNKKERRLAANHISIPRRENK